MAAGSYHYVIVGAGSAGCVLASRLSADPACRVALLEAGGPDRAREIHIPAGVHQTPAELLRLELPHHQAAGAVGSGAVLAAWQDPWRFVIDQRSGVDTWASRRLRRLGESCPGWSYDEVLPYFRRAERRVGSNVGGVYGTSGPQFISELRDPNPTTLAFLAACAELGFRRLGELNERTTPGLHRPQSPSAAGCGTVPRTRTCPARRRRNLTVLTGVHVQRILFDGARATGVEYWDAAGVTQRVTVSGEVILSAGAVNSPQLLMLSGIGEPEQLRARAWSHAMSWWALVRTCRTTWPAPSPFTARSRSHSSRPTPRPNSPGSCSCVAACSPPA